MTSSVKHLITYPIKGLSGHTLDQVALTSGRGFPMDRSFAFARKGSGLDPAQPKPMPKSRFHVLARDADLAKLQSNFDVESKSLTIQYGETSLVFDCASAEGSAEAGRFIADIVGISADEAPSFVFGGEVHFTDV